MKTIGIAPNLDDITCSDRRITAKWDGRTLIYELPEGHTFFDNDFLRKERCKLFQQAIALLSEPWKIEKRMNLIYSCNGKFWEE